MSTFLSLLLTPTLLFACRVPESDKAEADNDSAQTVDSSTDSAVDPNTVDQDGDGYTPAEGDCDDTNPTAHPGAPETAYDGVDEDCLGGDDNDADADGHASAAYGGDDCDDAHPEAFPGAAEIWYDGIDEDCLGGDDNDADADGYASDRYGGSDCDDADLDVHPGATEVCDGATDEDCDGHVDEDEDVLGVKDCPASSCLLLHAARPALPDGIYWVDVGTGAEEMVCDMSRDDGGWTLVANFAWPGSTAGVAGWTSGARVGTTLTDRTQSFKLSDDAINATVMMRYRARGTATTCLQGACAVDTTLYWDSACVYDSGHASTGACTAAFQTYDLQDWTTLSNPCSWHYGLTSADCGTTSEFGTSHDGDHVFVGVVGTYIHAYDGRSGEDPSIEVWVK